MINEDITKITLDYYNQKAKDFTQSTQTVDFSDFQNEFVKYLPKNATIIDLGCGAGRDSKAFIGAGYNVIAIDGSTELCKIASDFIGQQVICSTFQEYEPNENVDGIWACASLLHLSTDDVVSIMNKLSNHLNKGGCFYVSFKYGDFAGLRNGRYFQNMTEDLFNTLMQQIPSLKIISTKITGDIREGRENEKWLNVFLERI